MTINSLIINRRDDKKTGTVPLTLINDKYF